MCFEDKNENHTNITQTTFQAGLGGLGVASVDLWWGPFRPAPEYDKFNGVALNSAYVKIP